MSPKNPTALAVELGVTLRDAVEAAGFMWVVDVNQPDRRLVMTDDLSQLVATIRIDGYRFAAVDVLGVHASNLIQFRELLAEHTPDRNA